MNDPLAPVSELYARREQAALRTLAHARQVERSARDDLERIRALGHEYRTSLTARAAEGIDADSLRHLRGFLDRLDRGATVQSDMVSRVAESTARVEADWQDARRRVAALDAVRERRRLTLHLRAQRRDQRQQDEFAARRIAPTQDDAHGDRS